MITLQSVLEIVVWWINVHYIYLADCTLASFPLTVEMHKSKHLPCRWWHDFSRTHQPCNSSSFRGYTSSHPLKRFPRGKADWNNDLRLIHVKPDSVMNVSRIGLSFPLVSECYKCWKSRKTGIWDGASEVQEARRCGPTAWITAPIPIQPSNLCMIEILAILHWRTWEAESSNCRIRTISCHTHHIWPCTHSYYTHAHTHRYIRSSG